MYNMYFPYLRGRQYELIALRELVEKNLLSNNVVPIIEPVRLSNTLIKTIETYSLSNRRLGIITNPQVGSFIREMHEERNQPLKNLLSEKLNENSDNIIFFNYLQSESNSKIFLSRDFHNMGTICTNRDLISVYESCFSDKNVNYNLILDESGFRRRVKENRVLLDDKFNKQARNNDYIEVDDEPFSEDHLYYLADGYVGFSDYSIVGNNYNETGFAPYAVAIHIVYFDDKDNSLRVKHFVSDSNEDISDPAGKFHEALRKLVIWNTERKLPTTAMRDFIDLFNREAYPGLGTVKKLSIMHHLELVGKYLDS